MSTLKTSHYFRLYEWEAYIETHIQKCMVPSETIKSKNTTFERIFLRSTTRTSFPACDNFVSKFLMHVFEYLIALINKMMVTLACSWLPL